MALIFLSEILDVLDFHSSCILILQFNVITIILLSRIIWSHPPTPVHPLYNKGIYIIFVTEQWYFSLLIHTSVILNIGQWFRVFYLTAVPQFYGQ